jgi:ribosome recycling factor
MAIHNEFDQKIGEIARAFKEEVAAIRGSRPTPALVEDIAVEYYNQRIPVKQLGSITVVPPREIQVSIWDGSAVMAVAKAISAKLNVMAANEGNVIHVNLPALTQERRQELLKVIRSKAEEARIKSRTARDEVKKEINAQEKAGDITEDERFELNEKIQKIVDDFNKEVDAIVEKKAAEVNE